MPLYRNHDGDQLVFSTVRGPTGPRGQPTSECAAPRFSTDNPAYGEQCRRFARLICDAVMPGGQLCGLPLCGVEKEGQTHGTIAGDNRHRCPFHKDTAVWP